MRECHMRQNQQTFVLIIFFASSRVVLCGNVMFWWINHEEFNFVSCPEKLQKMTFLDTLGLGARFTPHSLTQQNKNQFLNQRFFLWHKEGKNNHTSFFFANEGWSTWWIKTMFGFLKIHFFLRNTANSLKLLQSICSCLTKSIAGQFICDAFSKPQATESIPMVGGASFQWKWVCYSFIHKTHLITCNIRRSSVFHLSGTIFLFHAFMLFSWSNNIW